MEFGCMCTDLFHKDNVFDRPADYPNTINGFIKI